MEMEQERSKMAKTGARWRLGRDALVASICGFVVVLMVGASYAAVPFYNWFCRATGFNGTTQVATSAPSGKPLARTIAVRFDSNVSGGLPWKFEPEQTEIQVHIGEVVTVYYTVTNQSARTTTGQAAYNVAPLNVGSYFEKINCFCFTEQTFGPGETRQIRSCSMSTRRSPTITRTMGSTPSRCPIPSIPSAIRSRSRLPPEMGTSGKETFKLPTNIGI